MPLYAILDYKPLILYFSIVEPDIKQEIYEAIQIFVNAGPSTAGGGINIKLPGKTHIEAKKAYRKLKQLVSDYPEAFKLFGISYSKNIHPPLHYGGKAVYWSWAGK